MFSQLLSFQCLTEDGKELTRVCLIDFHSDLVVYDQLVKPAKPVIDHLTRYVLSTFISSLTSSLSFNSWSGITPAALAPITTTHAEVQQHIMRLLSPSPHQPFCLLPTSASTTNTDTTKSLPQIRPQRTQDPPPLLHRYRPNISPHTWTVTQTWPLLAHSKMVRAGNPNSQRWAYPRRKCTGLLGVVEEDGKDGKRSRAWRVQDEVGVDF